MKFFDLGVQGGFVEKSGSWFSAEGERIGQGRENAKQYLLDHPEMMATLESKIRENAGLISEALLVGPDDEGLAPNLEVVDAKEDSSKKVSTKKEK